MKLYIMHSPIHAEKMSAQVRQALESYFCSKLENTNTVILDTSGAVLLTKVNAVRIQELS